MCKCCSGGKNASKYKKFAFLNGNDHKHDHDHGHDHDESDTVKETDSHNSEKASADRE